MLRAAAVLLALLASAAAVSAYEAWVAPAGPSTSVVVVNVGSTEGQAWLVHPDGRITSKQVSPGDQEVLPLGQVGPGPGIERAGHRLVTHGRMQAAVHWDAMDDAASGLIPLSSLGTDHYLMPTQGNAPDSGLNHVSIVATQDQTQVQVEFRQSARDGMALRPPGSVVDYELDAYEVLTLEGKELPGTRIVSDAPVAVFDHRGDHRASGGRTGTVAEQVPPTGFAETASVPCMPKPTAYRAYALTLHDTTSISVWDHDGTFSVSDFESAGSISQVDLWNGAAEITGTKEIQGMVTLGSTSAGAAAAYVPPASTWQPEVHAVVTPIQSGGVARVVAIHLASEVPTFSRGAPVATHALSHGSDHACSVTAPLPAGTTNVKVSSPGGVAAWTWTNSATTGTLAVAWPPCLAVDIGVKDLAVTAVAAGEGIVVVWSDPEADCQDTSFIVERSRDGAAYQPFAVQSVPGLSDKTVERCVAYTYRVSRSDGTGTARSKGTTLPDEFDCGPPPTEDPVRICPVLAEPEVVVVDGKHQAVLEVSTSDGEPWSGQVEYALSVLSDTGIDGEVDWSEGLLRLRVDEAPPGPHTITVYFEPSDDDCEQQEFRVEVVVTASDGGRGDDGEGDDEGADEDGPTGPETSPPLCPVLSTETVEAQHFPGDRFVHTIALSEGGRTGFSFRGEGLAGIPGVEFDAGQGRVAWTATEPGTYTGSVGLHTGHATCDREVFFRILVSPRPRPEPVPDQEEPALCVACETTTTPTASPTASPSPRPAATTAPAPACIDCEVPTQHATGPAAEKRSPGTTLPAALLLLLAVFVSRSSVGRRGR